MTPGQAKRLDTLGLGLGVEELRKLRAEYKDCDVTLLCSILLVVLEGSCKLRSGYRVSTGTKERAVRGSSFFFVWEGCVCCSSHWLWKKFVLCLPFAFEELERSEERPIFVVTPLTAIMKDQVNLQ